MTDDIVNIAVTDDGTIDELSAQLQALGLVGEAALDRLASNFTAVSAGMDTTAQRAQLLDAALKAGYTSTVTLGAAFDRLTTSEANAVVAQQNLSRIMQTLVASQNEGVAATEALAGGQATGATAADTYAAALERQVAAGEPLSRLQQNLLAREQALAAASQEAAAGSNTLVEAFVRQYAAMDAAAAAAEKLATADQVVVTAAGEAAEELAVLTAGFERTAGSFAAVDRAALASAEAVAAEGRSFAAAAETAEGRLAFADRLAKAELDLAEATRLSTAAAESEARAFIVAGDAAIGEAAKVEELSTATKDFGHSVSGLVPILAAAFAGNEIVHANDEYQKLTATLGTVTKSAGELSSVYQGLLGVSNDTQSALSGNVNLFVKLRSGIDDTKVSNQDLEKAVKGVDDALKLGNVTGQEAYRVQRTLSEIFSTGDGNASRYFQNLKRESPAAYKIFSDSAQALGYDLNNLSGELTKQEQKVDKAKAALAAYQEKHDDAGRSVQSLTSTIASEQKQLQENNTAIDAATAKYGAHSAKVLDLEDKSNKLTAAIGANSAALTAARSKQDAATDATERALRAKISDAEATKDNSTAQLAFIKIAENVADTNGSAANSYTTVSGALTVLKNNLIEFSGTSASTNIVVGTLKETIGLVANNLNIVIPAVLAFGTAIAVLKVVQVAKDVRDLALATGLLDSSLAPVLVSVGLFTAAVVIAIGVIQGLVNLFLPASQQLDTFGTIATTVKGGVAALSAEIGSLTKGIGANQTQVTSATGALNDNNAATTTTNASTKTLSDTVTTAAKTQADYTASLAKSKAASDEMASSSNILVQALAAVIDFAGRAVAALLSYIQAAAQAVGIGNSTPASNPVGAAPSPHARDGGTFHIAGGTGVDTKTIAVSPGEVVTVQTPAQYRAGVLPPLRPSQTAFADGGVTTGFGVDLGTGVSISANAQSASVTGYSQAATQTAPIAANNNTTATTASTGTATATTSGTPQKTYGTTKSADGKYTLTDLGNNTVANGGTGQGNAGGELYKLTIVATGTSALVASAPQLPGQTPIPLVGSGLPNLYAVIGGTGVSAGSSATSSSSTSTSATTAANENTIDPGLFNGVSNPTINGVRVGVGSFYDSTTHSIIGPTYHRDGGDMLVPGGTGVDSKLVNLAVSPGESIHVRTPQQRRDGAGGDTHHYTVNMPVSTPDATSFGKSYPQLEQQFSRGLRRIARK